MANIAKACEPQSDRQNYVDFMSGPQVFTVAGTSDYKDDKGHDRVNIHLVESPDRPFKPSATNLRLVRIGWGDNDEVWPGRLIKLDGDPEVTFGREKVGGIRVVALSHLEQPFTAKLPVTRGKKQSFRVERLDDPATPPPIPAFATVDEARAYYGRRASEGASPTELTAIRNAAPTQKENA